LTLRLEYSIIAFVSGEQLKTKLTE